jgi:hypothetical protein
VVGGLALAAHKFLGGHLAGVMLATTPVMVLPKDSKDLPGVRNFLDGVKQLCSASSIYEGPIKQMFDDLKAKLEAALAALPKESNATWSVNDQADQLFSLLACANNVAAALGLELGKMKSQMAGMLPPTAIEDAITAGTIIKKDDLEARITAAIAERTGEKGDLTTKELSQQLCSASHQKGIEEGIKQRNAELAAEQAAVTTANERKTAITNAGLPLPEAAFEAVLKAEAAAFEAAKTAAADRLKKFTEAGLELPANLLGKVWAPEADFKAFESTVMSIPALKKVTRPDEPLATGTTGGGSGKMIV